jgi:uncharacterized protein
MNASTPRSATPPHPGQALGLSPQELDELSELLAAWPPALEALDASMLDGLLAGVLLQRRRPARSEWLGLITNPQGLAWPRGEAAMGPARERIEGLALHRLAELDEAIEQRQWFDPWVWADDDESPESVLPWVLGFALAQEHFPELTDNQAPELLQALALIYQHLDADDLEDAEALVEEMESIEPPEDLSDATERLVRAVLLLADISRPRGALASPVVRPGQGGRSPHPGRKPNARLAAPDRRQGAGKGFAEAGRRRSPTKR